MLTENQIRELLNLHHDTQITRHHDGLWRLTNRTFSVLLNIRQKSEASWYKRGKRYEYGVALTQAKKYRQYPNLIIIIHEVKTGEVMYGSFAKLLTTARVYDGEKIDWGGTMFLRKCDMRKWSDEQCISLIHQNALSHTGN